MKIVQKILLNGKLEKPHNDALKEVFEAIEESIIIIPPKMKGNGVKPIKNGVIEKLKSLGWLDEHKMDLEGMKAKPLDAFKAFKNFKVGFEWETGNISSSFRALMKLYKGLIENQFDFGIHVLPSRKFYNYLTDRVGNISEMNPYINIYQRIDIPKNKTVLILVVEYDDLDDSVPPIPKGSDGMSLSRRNKKKS